MDATIWDHSSYSKNRKRILHSDLAVMFLRSICCQAEAAGILSDDHFTVDGTLIETWASLKSFRPKDELLLITKNRLLLV
jgi:Transposase and inactivated derivatives